MGAEDAVVFRVRRAVFAYDAAYQPFPLPRVTATFKVEMDGRHCSALIQPVPAGHERIVGRDVLNQQRVLFDGPAGQVVIDP